MRGVWWCQAVVRSRYQVVRHEQRPHCYRSGCGAMIRQCTATPHCHVEDSSAGSSLGSLDGLKEAPSVSFLDISPSKLRENGRACEVGGGNHKDPRGLVRFKQRVRGEWNDAASPSVSFLDISPAKAGREFRAPSGAVPRFWFLPRLFGRGRWPSLRGRWGQNDPYPRILFVVLRGVATSR
jgi:hypothetical protein